MKSFLTSVGISLNVSTTSSLPYALLDADDLGDDLAYGLDREETPLVLDLGVALERLADVGDRLGQALVELLRLEVGDDQNRATSRGRRE